MGGALDAIGDVFGGVMDALNPVGILGDVAGGVLGGVLGGGSGGGGIGGLGNLFDMATGLVDNVLGGAGGLLGGAGGLLGGLGDIVGGLFGGAQNPSIDVMQPFPFLPPLPFPFPGIGGLGGAQGAQAGGTSGAGGTGGVGDSGYASDGSLEALMAKLADKCDSMYKGVEDAVNKLGDNPSQKDLQKVQMMMDKYKQMTELLSNMQKDFDEMNMSIIRNIKG